LKYQYEFLRQLSADPANIVIGLARDVAKVKATVDADLNRSNVHIVHGDLDSYDSFKVSLAWSILRLTLTTGDRKQLRQSPTSLVAASII
jgi:hypothetical protein